MNIYQNKDNYIKVKVTGNKNDGYFLIDSEDYDKVSKHQWYIKDSTNTNKRGYICAKINNTSIKLHRFLMNVYDRRKIIDHINRDPWDNRKNNLRICTSSDNNKNTSFSKNNTSGRTGVIYKQPKNRPPSWVAKCVNNGKTMTKQFSVNKYGYDKAYELTLKQREEWEKEFNITTEISKERSETIETTFDKKNGKE